MPTSETIVCMQSGNLHQQMFWLRVRYQLVLLVPPVSMQTQCNYTQVWKTLAKLSTLPSCSSKRKKSHEIYKDEKIQHLWRTQESICDLQRLHGLLFSVWLKVMTWRASSPRTLRWDDPGWPMRSWQKDLKGYILSHCQYCYATQPETSMDGVF